MTIVPNINVLRVHARRLTHRRYAVHADKSVWGSYSPRPTLALPQIETSMAGLDA